VFSFFTQAGSFLPLLESQPNTGFTDFCYLAFLLFALFFSKVLIFPSVFLAARLPGIIEIAD